MSSSLITTLWAQISSYSEGVEDRGPHDKRSCLLSHEASRPPSSLPSLATQPQASLGHTELAAHPCTFLLLCVCSRHSHALRVPFLRQLSDPRFPQLCVLSAFLIGTEDIILGAVVVITVMRNNINDNGQWLVRSRDKAESKDVWDRWHGLVVDRGLFHIPSQSGSF